MLKYIGDIMPSAYLAINSRSGTPQLRRYNGLSSSLIGQPVIGAVAENYVTNTQPVNRVIQFGGANTFYVLQASSSSTNDVFRSTDGGNTWTSVLSTAAQNTFTDRKSGLNIIYNNGVPNLVFLTNTNGSNIAAYRSADGTSWVNDANLSFQSDTFWSDLVYRSSMICMVSGNSGGGSLTYTPGSLSFSSLLTAQVSPVNAILPLTANLVVFNDSLLCILMAGADTGQFQKRTLLLVLSSGIWVIAQTLATPADFAVDNQAKCNALVSGDFLYTFSPANVSGVWACYQISSSYVASNISSTVLPLGLLSGVGQAGRALCWVDGQVSPGADPDKYMTFTVSGAVSSALTLYKWMGPSTRMADIDNGSNAGEALSLNKNVEGSTFWTSGENHVELVNRSAGANGTVLYFNLYAGSGGTPTVNVRVWYGTDNAEYPMNAATLTNPSSGAITGGGTINSGIVVNNGLSSYQVTWDNNGDGVSVGVRTIIVLEVFN